MKTLFLLVSLTLLAGCDSPPPMSDAEAITMQTCMEKGWKPRFYANGAMRGVTCKQK